VLIGCACPFLALAFPPKDGSPPNILAAGIGGCVFALVGVALILYALYLNTQRVLVFRGGFAYQRGQSCRVVHWGEITAFWDWYFTFRVDLRGGQSLKVSMRYFGEPGLLRNEIEDQVTARLRPGALKRFKAGETLEFGPLSISREYLGYKGKEVPWGEVKNLFGTFFVQTKTRYLGFNQVGKTLSFCNVNTTKVPNVKLFLELVKEARPDLF
jgi:hypothetical protein